MGLMSKSGRLCSHCSPGALSKTLTGGSAGGRDPRRDQREWEGYWAHSPTHTRAPVYNKNTDTSQPHAWHILQHHRETRVTSTQENKTRNAPVRLFTSPECAYEVFLMQTNTQTHKARWVREDLSVSTSSTGKFSHMAKYRGPTSGSLAMLTAHSSQNQLGL